MNAATSIHAPVLVETNALSGCAEFWV
eukprot:COSAG02_NODE_15500_length_1165_cov_1.427767_1_plen_26_part_10